MSFEFAAPTAGSSDSLSPKDIEGHLLVVEPVEYVPAITTAFGEKDAIKVTVHDITAQTTSHDVLWFSGNLIRVLKGNIGKKILAVMGKGQPKAGQQPPWILVDASANPEAGKAATAYLTGQTAAQLTAPIAAPAPAAAVAVAPVQSELDAALANLAAAGITA